MKRNSNFLKILFAVTMATLVLSGCGKQIKTARWTVSPDMKRETLSIQQRNLGIVLDDIKFALKNGAEIDTLSDWHVSRKGNNLEITTLSKSVTWKISTTDSSVDFNCSNDAGLVLGIAPAPEARIPARVKSQDNGVMYTALGLISANNIHNLFDRKTDIMIQFPQNGRLQRDPEDAAKMHVSFPVDEHAAEILLLSDYYSNKVGITHFQKSKFKPVYAPIPNRFKHAATGWCSWYCYYMDANEAGMVKETDALAKELKPYGLEYVQLDACFTRGQDANWLDWTKKLFPKGGKWLFQYITGKGLKPGLWVNAYGANYAKPAMAKKYPENFFLRDKNGKLSGACCTADTTVVRLDFTNPQVIKKHLKPLFATLVNDWGMQYLKDAGWGKWMDYYKKNKANAFDSTMDSRAVYRNVQGAIRKVLGEKTYITGCAMHEVGVGFGYYDGSRVGGDDFARWAPPTKNKNAMSMQVFFNSLFGANYLNGICWWSDPDVVMVRSPLTMEEARTIVTTIALSGQTYMISDFMAKLPNERLELYKKTMPTMPVHAVDLFPFRTQPVCCPRPTSLPKALDMKINAVTGIYDVVAVYNWADRPAIKTVSFARDFGLNPGTYLVYDFWNEKLLGAFTDSLTVDIPIHGVRACVIRPLTSIPQVLATSRHISAARSIQKLQWDDGNMSLTGTSNTVANVSYELFLYVPDGEKLAKVNANTEVLYHTQNGDFAKVALQGKNDPVEWKAVFSK